MKCSAFLGVLFASTAVAQTCMMPTARFKPQMDTGWTSTLLINGLKNPRGMVFDQLGNMLVVEQGGGVAQIKFMELSCGYVCAVSSKSVLADSTVSVCCPSLAGKGCLTDRPSLTTAWLFHLTERPSSSPVWTKSTLTPTMLLPEPPPTVRSSWATWPTVVIAPEHSSSRSPTRTCCWSRVAPQATSTLSLATSAPDIRPSSTSASQIS
jgi:hypothetical protein